MLICRYKQNIILMMNHNLISSNRGVFNPLSLRVSPLSTFISQHPSASPAVPYRWPQALRMFQHAQQSAIHTADVCHLPLSSWASGSRWMQARWGTMRLWIFMFLFWHPATTRPQQSTLPPRVAFAMWEFRFRIFQLRWAKTRCSNLTPHLPQAAYCWWFRNPAFTSWGW